MSILALHKSLADNMSAHQKLAGGLCAAAVRPGKPHRYTDGAGLWAVYDDHRITLHDAAYGAAFVQHMADLPPDMRVTTKVIRAWLDGKGVTTPEQIEYTDGGDPWLETLQANGSPFGVLFAQHVPDNWLRVTQSKAARV